MALAKVGHAVGVAAGAMLAPWAAVGSAVRRARLFHPRGTVFWGTATQVPAGGELHALGAQLGGSVLVRFSGAWWKTKQWPDVLGCAIRFTHAVGPSVTPLEDDQDLLLATVRIPATTLLAPLTTHVDDYLRNTYFGVSPFKAPGLPRLKLRLRANSPAPVLTAPRSERIALAVEHGPVRLSLEARRAVPLAAYEPIAEVTLTERVLIDQDALVFDPFRAGRGLQPSALVHGMRIPVYAASRRARQAVTRVTPPPRVAL